MADRPHVLLVPYPRQGHINPMLQFAKILSSKGLKTTLIICTSVAGTRQVEPGSPVTIETISDGFDDVQSREKAGMNVYYDRLRVVGSQQLAGLIRSKAAAGHPARCLVYDACLPFGLDIARQHGLSVAMFNTQPCGVGIVYYYVHRGWLALPPQGSVFELEPLPVLAAADLPSFVAVPDYSPTHTALFANQFADMNSCDWVFFNVFQQLENTEINWLAKFIPKIQGIGPLVPWKYLQEKSTSDKSYGVDLCKVEGESWMSWLDGKEERSVIYVSYGTVCSLGTEQILEFANFLAETRYFFLWVVRSIDKDKIPAELMEKVAAGDKGLIVSWCPQLQVLAHPAVGCFVTHCGWNSTLEAICLGVPTVGVPQWMDQPTNTKYVESVWRVGVRAGADEKGIMRKDELLRCVTEVMEGERGEEMRENAKKWRELAAKAFDEGGDSMKNIDEFVAGIVGN